MVKQKIIETICDETIDWEIGEHLGTGRSCCWAEGLQALKADHDLTLYALWICHIIAAIEFDNGKQAFLIRTYSYFPCRIEIQEVASEAAVIQAVAQIAAQKAALMPEVLVEQILDTVLGTFFWPTGREAPIGLRRALEEVRRLGYLQAERGSLALVEDQLIITLGDKTLGCAPEWPAVSQALLGVLPELVGVKGAEN